MPKNILVADDEINIQKVLSAMLQKEGYKVTTASDGKEALALFKKEPFNLVISDLKMPEMDGITLLSEITTVEPGIPVIMITAHGTVETAVSAIKKGAHDFILKPFDMKEIKQIVEKALNVQEKNLESFLISPGDEDKIIGQSAKMQEVYKTIEKVSRSVASVYIQGESGTGKELVARAIHYRSPRKEKPFIKVNCAALPETLLESELFGYEKGAFTGANISKPGRFELANEGTLFLDEIAEMNINNQSKLFRVLQERELERVGGVRTIKVDIRLIVATSKNLKDYVSEGKFREELYYRLNVILISLPPLRERKEDIRNLVDFFIAKFGKREGKNIRDISDEAFKLLMDYRWHGNIRELENVIERMVVMEDSQTLQVSSLPEYFKTDKEVSSQKLGLKEESKLEKTGKEKNLIIEALQASKGNRTEAAKALGISRRTLQTKIKDYNLEHL